MGVLGVLLRHDMISPRRFTVAGVAIRTQLEWYTVSARRDERTLTRFNLLWTVQYSTETIETPVVLCCCFSAATLLRAIWRFFTQGSWLAS